MRNIQCISTQIEIMHLIIYYTRRFFEYPVLNLNFLAPKMAYCQIEAVYAKNARNSNTLSISGPDK